MKTYEDFYNELKAEHPTISVGSDNEVIQLDTEAYEAKLNEWANNLVAQQATEIALKEAEEQAKVAKAAAEKKLAALGLTADDLKALGL